MAPGYQPCCGGGDELSDRVAALRGRRSPGLPRASSARTSFPPRNTGQRLPPPWRVRIDIIAVRVILGARPSITRRERRRDRRLRNLRVGLGRRSSPDRAVADRMCPIVGLGVRIAGVGRGIEVARAEIRVVGLRKRRRSDRHERRSNKDPLHFTLQFFIDRPPYRPYVRRSMLLCNATTREHSVRMRERIVNELAAATRARRPWPRGIWALSLLGLIPPGGAAPCTT